MAGVAAKNKTIMAAVRRIQGKDGIYHSGHSARNMVESQVSMAVRMATSPWRHREPTCRLFAYAVVATLKLARPVRGEIHESMATRFHCCVGHPVVVE